MRTLDDTTLLVYANLNAMQSTEKEPADAACWNWALYGLMPLPAAQPSVLFGYVNRGETQAATRHDAATQIDANQGGVWANLQNGQALRATLNDIRAEYDEGPDNEAARNHIRDRVFELSLRAAGFTISDAPTPYRVCMFEPEDVVMWDHWWLELNGAVVETVTGEALHAYSDEYLAPAFSFPRDRVVLAASSGLSPAQRARVHARYVTAIHEAQAAWLELLAAGAGA